VDLSWISPINIFKPVQIVISTKRVDSIGLGNSITALAEALVIEAFPVHEALGEEKDVLCLEQRIEANFSAERIGCFDQ
jgi:hypothetical protein